LSLSVAGISLLLCCAADPPGGTGGSPSGGAETGGTAAGGTGGGSSSGGSSTGGATGGAPATGGVSGPVNKPSSTYAQNDASKGNFPFPQAHVLTNCSYPNYNSDDVQTAYTKWKEHFFRPGDGAVYGPENQNIVSEGIGYGMLIAVYMDDKAMFNSIWGYAQTKMNDGLMTWATNGQGSASDADEDMAYALLMAEKQWGGFQSAATTMIGKIWSKEVRNNHLTPGSNYNNDGLLNPSYFAPSYYRAFAKATASDSNQKWMSVLDAGYTYLAAATGTYGLVPNWTDNTGHGSTSHDSDGIYYGYDACRTPFRVALDYCETGEPRAKAYLDKVVKFFTTAPNKDGFTVDGASPPSSTQLGKNPSNAAFKGPAAVGAMVGGYSSSQSLWYTGLVNGGANPSAYFPGSWGVLSLMALSGNFWDMTK
jgi:endo-1,4-beta-D-glucanase Y